jgi:phosphoserine phosphatase
MEIVKALSDYVHFDYIIATEFEEINGIYTGGIKFPLVNGNAKKERIIELSKKLNIDLKKSKAFGDSLLDLEMLKIVGEAIVVNPKEDLRKISEKCGWKIIC